MLLVASSPAPVVLVSSADHHISDVDLDDPGFGVRARMTPWIACGRSKSALVLFAIELGRRRRDVASVPPPYSQAK